MTEDEAKTKWCPFVRDFSKGSLTPACNRVDGQPGKWAMCIGSACMMWRKQETALWNLKENRWQQPGDRLADGIESRDVTEFNLGDCGLKRSP